jgi:hypothetical protein
MNNWQSNGCVFKMGCSTFEDYATALERMIDRNPTLAANPSRKAISDALDRRITPARMEIEKVVRVG